MTPDNQDEASLACLPAALLLSIMEHIPLIQDRNSCSLTCRSFMEAERSTRSKMRLRCVVPDFVNVAQCFQSVQELDVSECQPQWMSFTHAGTDRVKEAFLAAFPSVTSLQVRFPDVATMEMVRGVWPNLEELTITGGADLTRDRMPDYALSKTPNDLPLAGLRVDDKEEKSEEQRMKEALREVQRWLPCIGGTRLRKLVNPGARITDSDLAQLARACPLLEHLEVQSTRGITDVGLRALRHCRLVTFVLDDWDAQFNNAETITDVGVHDLVTGPCGAPLATLKLCTYFSADIAGRILCVLAESAINLQTLALGQCELGVSPVLFSSLGGLFQRLHDIDFGNVFDNSVNDHELRLLTASTPNVTRLRVALSTQVTPTGLSWLGRLPQLREVILVSTGLEQANGLDVLEGLKPLQGQLTTLWLRTNALTATLAEVRHWPALTHLHLVYDGELEMLDVDSNDLIGLHQRPMPMLQVPDTPERSEFDAGLCSPGSTLWRTPSPVGVSSLARTSIEFSDQPRLEPLPEEEDENEFSNWVFGVRIKSETSPDAPGPSTPARLLAGQLARHAEAEETPCRQRDGEGSSEAEGHKDGKEVARSGLAHHQEVRRREGDWPALQQFALITTQLGLVDLRLLEGAERVMEVEIMLGTGLYLTEEVVRGYFHMLSSLPNLAKLRMNLYSDSDWFAKALGDAVCEWRKLRDLRLAMTWRGPSTLFECLLQSRSLQMVDARFDDKNMELQFYRNLFAY